MAPVRRPLTKRGLTPKRLLRWVLPFALVAAALIQFRLRPVYDEDDDASAQPSHEFCTKERPPMVCAHGGNSQEFPPNTAASFEAALASSVDCVEIDIARTRDGVLICMHVRELRQLMRTSDTELQVGDVRYLEIAGLSWPVPRQHRKQSDNFKILTAEQAIRLTSPVVDCVILDIKTLDDRDGQPLNTAEIVRDTVQLIHKTSCTNCLVWAKSDEVVSAVKDLSPGQQAGIIVMNETEAARARSMHLSLRMQAEVAGVHYGMCDQQLHSLLRENGMRLFTWTINDKDTMRRVLNVGVDALVTGLPRDALALIQSLVDRCAKQGTAPSRLASDDEGL